MTRPPSRSIKRSSPEKATKAVAAIRPKGFVKLVAIHPDGAVPLRAKCFEMPDDRADILEWIAARDGRLNLYLELNPPRVRSDLRSKESDISHVVYAFADCDPAAGEDIKAAQRRHHERLNSEDVPKPTFEYVSGNGSVGIWQYSTPIKLDGPASIEAAKAINVGIARKLGTKVEGFDSCQSLDHLYRIPNTTNLPDKRKRSKGRKVTVPSI
jgi:hypothetical protein